VRSAKNVEGRRTARLVSGSRITALRRVETKMTRTGYLPSALTEGWIAYEPAPAYANYDRAWDAAVRAAQESGIKLASADPTEGLILGSKDGIDVSVTSRRQAGGTTRVESNFKGRLECDPTLPRRFILPTSAIWVVENY
jgi:hypothetical protein